MKVRKIEFPEIMVTKFVVKDSKLGKEYGIGGAVGPWTTPDHIKRVYLKMHDETITEERLSSLTVTSAYPF